MTSKSYILTEALTTIIRMKDFMAKKDTGYPEDPAHNVCNGTQDPVIVTAMPGGNKDCDMV